MENEYLDVLKETATTFSQIDRHVIIQMDEVHIQSAASYKGGKILGVIDNPADPPTTVFSIMISFLAKIYSTIVRLIPLGSSSADILFPIVKNIISDIEACNLYVEAICTDNYPLNVSLFKLFSDVQKYLQPIVTYPCHHTRSLILFFDIVHIIKSIRNNWLNLADYEKTFEFPSFNDCLDGCSNYEPSYKGFCVSFPVKNLVVNTHVHPSIYPKVCTATFDDLRMLFKSEISNILKRAPKLTSKACWPSRLESQNVNLALKIFHESTYCGLTSFKIEKNIIDNNQTVEFLI